MNSDYLIEEAADLISRSRRMLALTGAGLSTPSGVPDFRSPRSGMWVDTDVMEIASAHAFRREPQTFYDWLRPLLETILQAGPNAAHVALAELEQGGSLTTLVTQNIDLLHGRAGSSNVHEIHGHLREVVCMACHYTAVAEPYLLAFLNDGKAPRCPRCHHILKPNVVLFGELLPHRALKAAEHAARTSDVMLVAGSSLEVEPAGTLPRTAVASGAHLIIVNKAETDVDSQADVVIRGDVAEVLPELAERVRQRKSKADNQPDME